MHFCAHRTYYLWQLSIRSMHMYAQKPHISAYSYNTMVSADLVKS